MAGTLEEQFKTVLQSHGVQTLIQLALDEDIGPGDATSIALVSEKAMGSADLVAREACVMCGGLLAEEIFRRCDPDAQVELLVEEGRAVEKGTVLLRAQGLVRALLTAERTALNFMQRLSGVATTTSLYVKAVAGYDCKVLDTRKTSPGYRSLQKYAVLCGGGQNHRMGLYDRIMMKDNHVMSWHDDQNLSLVDAVKKARSEFPDLLVEVEADRVDQVEEVLPSKPDWILLDNMNLQDRKHCVALCKGIALTEASGGVTLDTIAEIAATGVDAISVGALTHSSRAVDLALDLRTLDDPA